MKKLSNMSRYKQHACPTCKAGVGENCASIGKKKGATAGKVMTTSAHTARKIVAGLAPPTKKPRTGTKAKKGKHNSNRARGLKAWRTRQKRERERLDLAFEPLGEELVRAAEEKASLKVEALGNSSLLELVGAALNILASERVHELTLHGSIANIHAEINSGVITLTIND